MREFAGMRTAVVISPQTRLDADLGVTGEDGRDLLEAAARHFGAKLADPVRGYRETFSLAEDEYLFHAEGLGPGGVAGLVRWLLGRPAPKVRDLTLTELHDAILRTGISGEHERR